MRARWEGVTLAESEGTVAVEGNHYFPPESIEHRYFRPSDTHTTCTWKGVASYFDIVLEGGRMNRDAAWYYPDPKPAAASIKDRVAFWHGVTVKPMSVEEERPARA
ncbi:MAG: DUF427 domain-containing protein [Candidatus Dormibacteraceae bacterium]